MDYQLVLTKKYSEICGRIITDAFIHINDDLIKVNAQWDTGATRSSISKELINELGLESIKHNEVTTTVGIDNKAIYDIEVVLKYDSDISIPIEVSEGDNLRQTGIDLLIGMDIIHFGDFAISNYNDETCFSFRIPSKGLIDFTKE